MEIKIWNKEEIIAVLDEKTALNKAILALYARQTRDERLERKAVEENKTGYSKLDAKFFSTLAEKIYLKKEFTEAELAIAKNKIKKYAGQLTDIANKKVANMLINTVKKEVIGEVFTKKIFIANIKGIKNMYVDNTYSYNLLIFMKRRDAIWDKKEERWELNKKFYKNLVDLAIYEYTDLYTIEELSGYTHKEGKLIPEKW